MAKDGTGQGEAPKDDPPLNTGEAPGRPTDGDGGGASDPGGGGANAKLTARINELEQHLARAQQALSASALEQQIEGALAASGVIDAETGRLLLAHTLEGAPEMSVEEALASLKRRKPFLFGAGVAEGLGSGATLAARGAPATVEDELGALKDAAHASGDRAEVLRYLRARRGA